jgi:menaquinol-cytochrome c reductase cytochrome b/c subunit
MFLSLAAIVYLTNTAWTEYKHEMAETGQIPEDVQREEKAAENRAAGLPATSAVQTKDIAIVDKDDPAMALYKQATCVSCHAVDMKGGGGPPSLRGVGDTHDKAAILTIIKEGQGQMPPMYETAMGAGLSEQDIDDLAGWLAKQKSEQ